MKPGSILAGRYRVNATIGRGGMGIVVEATHLQLGTPVAIKLLHREALEEPALVERFLREARSAARLRGEHVCRVTDFGTTDEGIPFMVMEHLDGEDLGAVVDRNGPFDSSDTATYILQACIGVAEAHALGIVHRDLKPGNLFLVRSPDGKSTIKLLDFGIAKSMAIDSKLTQTTKAMGSPAYMSPEQLRSSSSVDPRSDIWSLGVTMFELLTEKRPFDGDTPYELTLKIATEPAAAIPDTVPLALAGIVMRCLDKDPDHRYADVAELAAALAPFAKRGGQDLAASVRTALAAATGAERERAPRTVEPSPATETTLGSASGAIGDIVVRSRSRIVIGLVIASVATIAIGAIVWWPSDKTVPQPSVDPVWKTIDAAETPVAADPPDAAVVEPPDAAATDPIDAADPLRPEVIDAGAERPTKPPRKKPRTPKQPKQPVDLGRSRF